MNHARELKKLANELSKAALSEERENELTAQGWKWLPESGSYGPNDVEVWVEEALDKIGYDLLNSSNEMYWSVIKKGDPRPVEPTQAEMDTDTIPSHWVDLSMPGSMGARDMWEEFQKRLPNFGLKLDMIDEEGFEFFKIN